MYSNASCNVKLINDGSIRTILHNINLPLGLVTLATFTDIVSSLPDISERELLSAFKLFDVNSDGSLSLDELAIMLTKVCTSGVLRLGIAELISLD